MSFSQISLQDDAMLQLFKTAGVSWDVADGHYLVLAKDTYTPSTAHKLYSDISSYLCTSTNYAAQNVESKTLTETAGVVTFDCGDVDFTNGEVDDMEALYLCLVEGDYSSPDSGDVFLAIASLNVEGSVDITIDTDIIFEESGLFVNSPAA